MGQCIKLVNLRMLQPLSRFQNRVIKMLGQDACPSILPRLLQDLHPSLTPHRIQVLAYCS